MPSCLECHGAHRACTYVRGAKCCDQCYARSIACTPRERIHGLQPHIRNRNGLKSAVVDLCGRHHPIFEGWVTFFIASTLLHGIGTPAGLSLTADAPFGLNLALSNHAPKVWRNEFALDHGPAYTNHRGVKCVRRWKYGSRTGSNTVGTPLP